MQDARRVLITGAGGFIGHHVTARLAQDCESLVALTGAGDPRRSWPDNVISDEVDILNTEQIAKHMQDVDCVIHLAGPPSVRDSFSQAQLFAAVHTGGTANILQVAKDAGVRRFVYLSSAEVYGQPLENPVSESHRLLARSPYGAAKIGAERFVESFTQFSEIEAVILRPFSIYGPGQTMNSLLGTILQQLETKDEIQLADLRPIRDYCYVEDLANAVAKACFATVQGLAIVNIGSGSGTSVLEFAKLTAEASDKQIPISQAASSDRPDKANIMELLADRRLAKGLLDWKPKVSLLDGLRKTIQHAEVAR